MADFIRFNQTSIVNKLEDTADLIIRKTRRFLPHTARICLTATFIEDSIRLITQWSDQYSYIKELWKTYSLFVFLFLVVCIISQLLGSGMVIMRYRVKLGCAILMMTLLLQTIGYGIINSIFIMRNLALLGGLILIVAEANEKVKSSMAGLPEMGINQSKQYMLFCGRILILLIFLTIIHWGGSFFYIIQALANLVLIVLVAIGYKTKLCAVILVLWLLVMNFWYNNFWYYLDQEYLWDFLKYDFFQTWSVIGGLMMVVAYGPGGVSVDDYKKDW